MPEILHRCVSELMAKGHDEPSAWAICRTSLGMSVNDEETMRNAHKMADDLGAGKKKEYAAMQTKDIDGVEIFASGTWNGDVYLDKDLDEMVDSFKATKGILKPFLKLGHDEGQALTQEDGYPALGWVENLRRKGSKLIADFKRIPRKIYDLIQSGGYRRVSSEIYFDVELNGKRYGKALKAVALLGGDTPAVQNLQDIMSLYSVKGIAAFTKEASVKSYESDIGDLQKEETNMTIEQLQAKLDETLKKLAESEAKVKDYTAKDQAQVEKFKAEAEAATAKCSELTKEIMALKSDKSDLEGKLSKFTDEADKAKVTNEVDRLIREKKILPAQKESCFEMLIEALKTPGEKKYKVGDKEVSKFEHVLSFMEKQTVNVSTEQKTQAGERQNADLDSKAKKFIEDEKKAGRTVSYSEALISVSPKEGIPAPKSEGE